MCLTNYWHELGEDSDGVTVYGTISDLRSEAACVDLCGIAEVEVRLRRIVQEPKE
jgi:hypothetical protein